MKKIILISLITFSIGFGHHTFAQNTQINLGGGFSYGSEIEKPGINLRADFRFPKGWVIAPDFNFFFTKNNNNSKITWTTFNIDGHYLIGLSQQVNFYPLAGFNYTTVNTKVRDTKYTNHKGGLNIGMGLDAKLASRLKGFVEVKYVVSNESTDQAVVMFGLLYGL